MEKKINFGFPKILSNNQEELKDIYDNKTNAVVDIEIEKLVPFRNHIFKSYSEEKLEEMKASIEKNGIINPIIVRKIERDKFEILVGHNRTKCATMLEHKTVPCIIKDVDDETATLIMIDTNLNQREDLLPSEKAKAYKMKFDTLRLLGERENNLNYQDIKNEIVESEKTSERQIDRYLRLNHLNERLLEMVDSEKLGFYSGVNLSFIDNGVQEMIANLIYPDKHKLSIRQSEELKELNTNLTEDKLLEIVTSKNRETKRKSLKLNNESVEKYFIGNQTDEEKINIIIKSLALYFQTHITSDV